ncbi:small subunit processome component 20 homolog [Fukomys damarensis]|uniref:small subunit processome component 20 homolog n=1 Tax=Fukomys damarensis TaxID=885580 RepID=UPI0014553C32|nr:small subunit processome component 20 homolog [Fukomys damarensis]
MKIKPVSHKTENTYRFLTFAERLGNVNIDIIHRIDRTASYDEEVETYFLEALLKWRELNLTEHFGKFYKEVVDKCQSFNQLVYHQNEIVQSLKTHLQVRNSFAYQPLLDLVVQLARDLQTDFYPHFPDFFLAITSLLETQDTELLEWAFTALSYLYKYLWRLMVKDMASIYSMYSTLLAHRKLHIRNFAAESFTFLMRKVSDKSALFNVMFLDLNEHPEKVEGVGQLLFEMCRGVRNMFHSCAGQAVKLILQKLGPVTETETQLPWSSVGETLKNMAKSTVLYVHREHFGTFLDCLQESLLDLHNKVTKKNSCESSEQMTRLLETYLILVKHRSGSKISNAAGVCKVLSETMHIASLSVSCRKTLLDVISALLLGGNVSLPDTLIRETIEKVFESRLERRLIFGFSEVMFAMKQFEQLFLPSFLVYTEDCFSANDSTVRGEALAMLAKLILNKAPPAAGSMATEKYPLLFRLRTGGQRKTRSKEGEQQSVVLDHLLSVIQSPPGPEPTSLAQSWAALVVLPHVRPLEKARVLAQVMSFVESLFRTVDSGDFGTGHLFVLCQAVSTLLSLEDASELLRLLPVDRVKNLVLAFPTEPPVLLLAELYYQRLALCGCRGPLSEAALMELLAGLQANLSAGASKIRLLTIRILNHFDTRLPESMEEDAVSGRPSAIAVLHQAELVPATVHDYREKLLHLRKLRHDAVCAAVPDGPLQEVPLRYLLGMLYVNFSALWDPVIELISSHAHGMENKQFWKVYYEHLEKAAARAEKELQSDVEDKRPTGDGGGGQTREGGVGALYEEQLALQTDCRERLDHANFRFLLWRALAKFPERVEPRSRELSPLFLRFINNEYYPVDLQVAPAQDLRKRARGSGAEEAREEPAAGDEEDLEEEASPPDEPPRRKKTRRAAVKQLIVHLQVFSKFSNPRALYLESKLYELYLQLLLHQDQTVQKITLDCIMTYKHPHILPYRENLQRLLDDRTFKEEIVHFSISEDSAVVRTAHRAELFPILMRILYGRMKNKTGSKTQGKAAAGTRTAIVLRFLAGTEPEEVSAFLSLLVEPVKPFGSGECHTAVLRAVDALDLARVLPLGRQHGVLNSLEMVLKNMSHLIHAYLPTILQILLCVTATASHVLEQREKIQLRFINPLKNLRRLGIKMVTDIFLNWESYQFKTEEIDAVFHGAVWPQICRLGCESQYSPTPLLKLISVWSRNARYFPLLAKQKPGHPECDVLTNVFAVLSAKKLSEATASIVMDMVDDLLNLPDPEPSDTVPNLPVTGCVFAGPAGDTAESITVGGRLILPHVPVILQYLSKTTISAEKVKKKKNRVQVSKELGILSKLSKLMKDKQQSSVLITLLLPFLHHGSLAQDTEVDILVTVQNLLRHCVDPTSFLKPLARLFSVVKNKLSRQLLCTVFQGLSDFETGLKYITDVAKLNAFDQRHLDDINFDVRFTEFQTIAHHVREMQTVDVSFLVAVMHSCFYNMELGDMSLSDSASVCLTSVVRKLAALAISEKDYREVVHLCLLERLRRGLRSPTESIQQDYTTILSCLILAFPERPEFRELVQLTHWQDPEMDFFENMKHIQIHRRARALKRLAKQLTEGTVVLSSKALQNYVMPYALTPVLDEKMRKHENMTVAATEAIGAVCRHLAWPAYVYYLKRFIHVLQAGQIHQKLGVNLLVTTLEAFHFDHRTLEEQMGRILHGENTDMAEMAECPEEEAMDVEPPGEEEEEDPRALSLLPRNAEELQRTVEAIHRSVTGDILPRLHKCLASPTKREEEHKLIKSKVVQDEEVVRVPLAFAMVKLLRSLPQEAMEANLPSILLKVCALLKNRAQEVRDVARSTLARILEDLGVRFLQYVLRELQTTLVRGYQVHVLTFTVHLLLQSLASRLRVGDLDACLDILTQIFNQELFGAVAEEKEVKQILSKVMEARRSKSYESYEILGKFVGRDQVTKLILPLKEVRAEGLRGCAATRGHPRVGSCAHSLGAQLLSQAQQEEPGFIVSPHAAASSLRTHLAKSRYFWCRLRRVRQAPALGSPLPGADFPVVSAHGVGPRLGVRVPQRRSRVPAAVGPEPGPSPCVTSRPPAVFYSKAGFHCNAAVSRKTSTHVLIASGLQLLHLSLKTAKVRSSSTRDLEMLDPFVSLCVRCQERPPPQLPATLPGVGNTVGVLCGPGTLRRACVSFALPFEAILSRKLLVPEVEDVMRKVSTLAISPPALSLSLPQGLLHENCGLLFVPLCLTMVNDASASCRKMASLALKALLGRLGPEQRDRLFHMVAAWFGARKRLNRQLAALTCGLFVESEGADFEKRLGDVLPIIEKEIDPENFRDIAEETEEKATDRLLFSFLTLLNKLARECSLIQLTKPAETLSRIWSHTHTHLRHPHSWVWFTAAQVFGLLFAACQPEIRFLTSDLDLRMKSLSLAACHQLHSRFLDAELGEQVVKNALDLGAHRVEPYLPVIVAPLFRELNSTYSEQDPALKNLSQEIIELLKKLVGLESFSAAFASVQRQASEKRAQRKRKKALEFVTNPDIAAKKKMKKHKNKSEAKKRKIEFLRPGYKAKRHRGRGLRDLAVVE